MADVNRRVACSLAEYMDIVDAVANRPGAGLWFRGQSRADYRLVPSALRHGQTATDGRGYPVSPGQQTHASGGIVVGPSPERMLAEFKRSARPYLGELPSNDFEWMFIAQHYGLPTRLLDWSTNALVALYFAVSGAGTSGDNGKIACSEFLEGDEHRSDGSAVFIIDPGTINDEAGHGTEPVDIAQDAVMWDAYRDPMSHQNAPYSPICVVAPHISPRIRAQSGVFSLHGFNVWPLDYYDALRPLITKVFLPFSSTALIRQALSRAGVDRSFIYPGLESLAYDIVAKEHLRYSLEQPAP